MNSAQKQITALVELFSRYGWSSIAWESLRRNAVYKKLY